jgi:hypothetical protein
MVAVGYLRIVATNQFDYKMSQSRRPQINLDFFIQTVQLCRVILIKIRYQRLLLYEFI